MRINDAHKEIFIKKFIREVFAYDTLPFKNNSLNINNYTQVSSFSMYNEKHI